MWWFTKFGFFSVVQKPGDAASGHVTVRARAEGDLEALRNQYLPEMGPIEEKAGTDYRFRAKAPKAAFARAVQEAVLDIDYSNFKSAVGALQGHDRAAIYENVWSKLLKLQTIAPKSASVDGQARAQAGRAYGGVLFNDEGLVLLRKPANEYDGYVWTFPKGKPRARETIAETALRETREESGCEVEIIAPVPGGFAGGTGPTQYFVMRPIRTGLQTDAETAEVRWVTPEEAVSLISETRNVIGRRRDLNVLAAALKVWEAL